uniref:protein-tyrosine-phosphatase n=1 Tax=Crassostrea virginica TaxID=6565 RepID=A0A8B8BI60_CRAVI|nr:receptor-type tyrosine-protein phosphatase alpha-like [Crassostrea virginica]
MFYSSYLQFSVVLIMILKIISQVVKEANQSSTNGSFSAGLGCDGDLDTFSVTMEGVNQWWSATLDKEYQISWIFIRIEGDKYLVSVERNNSTIGNCIDITNTISVNLDCSETIISCTNDHNIYAQGNKIRIQKGKGRLKIFEVTIMGIVNSRQGLYNGFTNFPEASKALDKDFDTYYSSKEQSGASWFLRLDAVYRLKWILASISGGNYELYIKKEPTAMMSPSTLCKKFRFDGSQQNKTILECREAMLGDTIIVKKTDDGPLSLYELQSIVCSANHYGPSCARCRRKCQSCDSITGICTQCPVLLYGQECQHSCPQHCLDQTCDLKTGNCNGCKHGYKGQRCEHERRTTVASAGDLLLSTKSNGTTTRVEENYRTADPFTRDTSATIISDSDKGNDKYRWVLLACILVVLTILVLVVIILFSKRVYNQRRVPCKDKDTSILSEHQWELDDTTNDIELQEISQNETGDIEEEVIAVEYMNLTSRRVPIEQFLEDLPHRKNEGILEKEFGELPNGLLEFYSNALKSSNRNKSRYKGIFPYDYNGVRLNSEYANNEDFVNASYIHGYTKDVAYIAVQGPFNQRTLEDFWRMIWQSNSSRVVMLTSLYEGDKMMCLKYWPDINHSMNFGAYTITLNTEDVYDFYTLRTMSLNYEEDVKTVTQFHFTAWPDNSVPEDMTSLINFRNLVKSNLDSSEGPIVVHCSAGIGRTGTFIALDYIIEEAATEQTVDVKGYVISLRHQRGNSIQTHEQYLFLHDAVAEGLTQTNVHQRGLDAL